MSRTMNQSKGTKRRVRRIRWTRSEKLSAVLFLLVLVAEVIWLGLWLMGHPVD